jgi:hypothetical protein
MIQDADADARRQEEKQSTPDESGLGRRGAGPWAPKGRRRGKSAARGLFSQVLDQAL